MRRAPVILVLLGLGLAALADAAEAPAKKMQYRTFLRGNLPARGPIQPNGTAKFVSLVIGEPKKPLNQDTPFFVRLGSGKVIESSEFTLERIAELAGDNKVPLERSEW